MRRSFVIAGIALTVALAASGAFALTPMWETEVEFAHPELYTVKTATGDQPYWYVIYTIHNPSEQVRQIQPAIRMVTGAGKSYEDLYIPAVVNVMNGRKGGNILHAGSKIVDVKAGETRTGVAVFNKILGDSTTVTLWAYGFSAKRVETRGGVAGVFSRSYKEVFKITGDRHNFAPARLTREFAGFVGVFRAPNGTTTEEAIVIVPIEDEVKAMRAIEAAETAKQRTPAPKPAEEAVPPKEESAEPAVKINEEAAPTEEGAAEATEAPAKEDAVAEEAKDAPATEEGAAEEVKEAPAEKAAPAGENKDEVKKDEKPAKKEAGTEKKAVEEAPAAE